MTSHSTRRRVVITGLGTVNPLALNVTDYWRGLLAGRSGIAPITRFDTANWQQTNGTTSAFKVTFGGEVKGFSPEPTLDTKAARHLDRFAQFAIVAAFEAVTDSGLDFAKENPLLVIKGGYMDGAVLSPAEIAKKLVELQQTFYEAGASFVICELQQGVEDQLDAVVAENDLADLLHLRGETGPLLARQRRGSHDVAVEVAEEDQTVALVVERSAEEIDALLLQLGVAGVEVFHRDGQVATLVFEGGDVTQPLKTRAQTSDDRKQGTTVRVWPDAKYFESAALPIAIRARPLP